MMTAKDRRICTITMAAAFLASLLCSCQPCAPIWGPGYPDMGTGTADCGNLVKKNTEFTVKDLAGEIDQLEKHVEKFGSIVPKHADVWGEARLMLHRQEFERQMSADLDPSSPTGFKETFQASVYRSDQAYLASALSLQAAVATRRRGSTSTVASPGGGTTSTNTVETKTSPSGPASPQLLFDPSQLTTAPDTVIKRSSLQTYTPPGFSPGNTLSLEPTLVSDQKARFLYHLNELRRINTGDDNADAPGYMLNLVRIPISVLTGSCTQTGCGGECTVTATPHLPDDLLLQTFRGWVVNDLVNLLTLPVTKIIEYNSKDDLIDIVTEHYKPRVPHMPTTDEEDSNREKDTDKSQPPTPKKGDKDSIREKGTDKSDPRPSFVDEYGGRRPPEMGTDKSARSQLILSRMKKIQLVHLIAPIQSGRGDQYPVPATQLHDVVGLNRLLTIAAGAFYIVKDHLASNGIGVAKDESTPQRRPYHLDVRAFLQEELNAAYDLLGTEKYAVLWQSFCTPVLVEAIRSHDVETLKKLEEQFESLVEDQQKIHEFSHIPESVVRRAVKPSLAWCVIFEAALLNDRLMKDMRATQIAKGCLHVPDGWLPLYGPHPPVEMCQLFNDFVWCRWPLYVFAFDPATDDQNIMDQYDLRREMQLALALAFTSGQIGAGSMTRYVRRIEEDMSTIAINRTIVGFSHGPDTFGWRFYPRVQTPPIPGNLSVIFRDMFLGRRGPRYDLRYRRLENGVRECDALVVMPTIVPYVDLEFTSNWFALANPKCKRLNLKETMRLSQRVQAIRESSSLACDTHAYRPGDPALLMRRLEQLSLRLPLQHQLVNVPFENTHGGYDVLATGVDNLAPRLSGWYGAPGIDPSRATSLFLVGNNFSVTQTRAIVGGNGLTPLILQPPFPGVTISAPQVELLSREVMRVTIPSGAISQGGSVDVHVATPYGVSPPLTVPVIGGAGLTSGPVIDPNNARLRINYCWGPRKLRKVGDAEGKIRLVWSPPAGQVNRIQMRITFNEICVSTGLMVGQNGIFGLGGNDPFAQAILDALANTQKYSATSNPLPASLVSSKIEITPMNAPQINAPVSISDPVRIELKLCCDQGP